MFILLFFDDTATTEIYTYLHTLSLHDALPRSGGRSLPFADRRGRVLLLERHTQGNPIPLDRPCSLPVQSAGVNAVIVPPVPSQSRSKDTWSPILTADRKRVV